MNKLELIEFITEISKNGVSYAHGKGFEFFRDTLLPNVQKAGEEIDEKELIADCWYVVGDIYDFNDAPVKAIESYKKAIEFDPKMASAFREIGSMQEKLGEYAQAVLNLKKAIQIEPTDEDAITDLREVENLLRQNSTPLYLKEDLKWTLSELLANQCFEEVIRLTEGTTGIYELKRRACALGGLGKDEAYLKLWRMLEQSITTVEIEYSDWFFMPDKVYEASEIWKILKRLNSRIKSSIFIQSDSLNSHYKELSDANRRELMCDYQIYDNTGDRGGLGKLRMQYPKWEEVNPLARVANRR